MVDEQKPAPSDIETLKKELADIKNDMMRKELEEIKREKMREELEEIRAEKAQEQAPQRYYAPYRPKLSILTILMAMLTLLVAGYILGTLLPYNLAAEVDSYIAGYHYPITGAMVLAITAIVLIFIGFGFVTMAKK